MCLSAVAPDVWDFFRFRNLFSTNPLGAHQANDEYARATGMKRRRINSQFRRNYRNNRE